MVIGEVGKTTTDLASPALTLTLNKDVERETTASLYTRLDFMGPSRVNTTDGMTEGRGLEVPLR